MFYYLQWASWESTYHAKWQNMTIDEYANSKYAESNWMTRMLTRKLEGPLGLEDLASAKEVLRRKCLVGLVERFEESTERFEKFFGWRDLVMDWEEKKKCQRYHLEKRDNAHDHPKFEERSYVWELLRKLNLYDMELYEYAVNLFEEQKKLVELYNCD